MIAFRVDGREVAANDGETVLRAAKRAGIEIPSLCDHEAVGPHGACRLCMVEVTSAPAPGRPARMRLAAACELPASAGISVVTSGDRLAAIRRYVTGLLLVRAPEAPAIRALAERFGVEPMAATAPADGCVRCDLCVRVCAEVVGAHAVGVVGRGGRRGIGMPYDEWSGACIGCGACDATCPTGILRNQEAAAEAFRRLPGEDRACRYSRLGVVPGAVCAIGFRCGECEIEAAMRDRFGPGHPVFGIARSRRSGGTP